MDKEGHNAIIRAFFVVSILVGITLCSLQALNFFIKSDCMLFGLEATCGLRRLHLPFEYILILFHTLVPGIVILFWGNQAGIIFSTLTWVVYVSVLFVFYKVFHLNGPFSAPALGAIISIIRVMGWRSTFLEEEKKLIKSAFSHFLEPSVVDLLLNDPELVNKCGTKKVVTILFADLRGFSLICEEKSPEVITVVLREYFGEMIAIARKNKGTVDKLMGDGIMIVFGYPLPLADHAEMALVAAIQMQQAMRKLQDSWRRRFGLQTGIGIGINTAEVVVGIIGSEEFYDYTVVGSGVNLAARIEAHCPMGEIHLSRSTQELVRGKYELEYLGQHKLRNIRNREDIYNLRY